jgi:hypothetical protein
MPVRAPLADVHDRRAREILQAGRQHVSVVAALPVVTDMRRQ